MYTAPACRFRNMRRLGLACRFIAFAGILITLLCFLFRIFTGTVTGTACKDVLNKVPDAAVSLFYQGEYLRVFESVMPVLRWSNFEDDPRSVYQYQPYWYILWNIFPAGLHDPSAVLRSQAPVLALLEQPDVLPVSGLGSLLPGNAAQLNYTNDTLSGDSLVIIYNTHSGETYSMTDKVERLDGRQGGVITVAAALQEALESKYGIKVTRSDRLHDVNYDTSYQESEKTVRELLAANPEARMVFDIHRDSGKSREQSVVKINGQNVAPLLFIVGSGTRRPFAGWRQNYTFATALSSKANEMYPGLSLGVRVKDGNYNQSLHPHSVLVEVGTSKNSIEEAVRSAVLFADIVARVIKE